MTLDSTYIKSQLNGIKFVFDSQNYIEINSDYNIQKTIRNIVLQC